MCQKPILIDQIVHSATAGDFNTYAQFGTKWYIAKPLRLSSFSPLGTRIKHAWLVLFGTAFAFHYAEDQIKVE